MPRVWRLCKRAYAASAFDGEGAKRSGGRWNPPGIAVVYCSQSISLAALELLVHVDPSEAPSDMVVIPVDIPAGLGVLEVAARTLPNDWRSTLAPAALQQIGADWVLAGTTAVLSVPSVLVPDERKHVLNPAHPDFARLERGRSRPFALDPRLYG